MKVATSYLKTLLAAKEVREHRTISLRKMVEESGASVSTVNRLANNTIKRLPLDDLATICVYLKCEIGDLLRLEEDNR
jgi:putative transcriptional regulator